MSVLRLLTPIDPRIVLPGPRAALTATGAIGLLPVERVHHLHILSILMPLLRVVIGQEVVRHDADHEALPSEGSTKGAGIVADKDHLHHEPTLLEEIPLPDRLLEHVVILGLHHQELVHLHL